MLSNAEVLCFVLGWQGGTVHKVAKRLGVTARIVLDADDEGLRELCRKAQRVNRPTAEWNASVVEKLEELTGGKGIVGWTDKDLDALKAREGM